MAKTAKQLLKFPFAGRNSNFGYESIPDGACIDCLNALPFDPRGSRLRGGQRSGTRKLTPTPLVAGKTVLRLHQATRPATEANAGKIIWQDIFNANDDSSLNTYKNSPAGTYWRVTQDGSWVRAINGVTYPSSGMIQRSGRARSPTTGGMPGNLDFYQAILVNGAYPAPTDNFRVQAHMDLDSPGGYGRTELWLFAKASGAPYTAHDGIVLLCARDQINLRYQVAGSDIGLGSYSFTPNLLTGVLYEFTLEIIGNTINAYVDGVLRITATRDLSAIAANKGVGFGFGGNINNLSLTGTPTAGFADFTVRELPSPGRPRQTKVAAVCDGNIFFGDNAASLALAQGGAAALMPDNPVSSADVDGNAYFVDGVNSKSLDINTGIVSNWTAETYDDLTPKGQVPQGCKILAVYRTRVVLAGQEDNPQNIYMSRAGNARDFDYGQDDAQAAVALNASSTAGQVGQPVTALIPFRDDSMLIGCDHGLFLMDGDPADGGSITTVSEAVGVLGKDAWCQDPAGNIYFIGTGGLWMMQAIPGSQPKNLTRSSEATFFTSLNRSTHYLMMCWDRDREGCWVFVTVKATGQSLHYWYDASSSEGGAFFPQRFPDDHGPVSALVYDGDGPLDRYLMLGGRDGHVRSMNPTDLTDDGQAIESYVYLGPFRPGGVTQQGRCTDLEFYLGELPAGESIDHWRLNYLLQSNKDAYSAFAAPRWRCGGVFTAAGRQLHRRQRQLGGAFFLKLFNSVPGTFWTLEQVVASFEPAGTVR